MRNLLFVILTLFFVISFLPGCNAPSGDSVVVNVTPPTPSGSPTPTPTPEVSDPAIQFVDRQGNPYSNMKVTLVDSVTKTNTDYTTDASGMVDYPRVAQGTVISLVQNRTVSSSENEYTSFSGGQSVTVGSEDKYTVVLERVAYTEFDQNPTVGPDDQKFNGSFTLVSDAPGIAQAFTATATQTICSVGIGAYIPSATEMLIAVFTDNGGQPGDIITDSSNSSIGYATDTESGSYGSMADFCANGGSGVSVTEGTVYWVAVLFSGDIYPVPWTPVPVTLSVLNSSPQTYATLSRGNMQGNVGWFPVFTRTNALDPISANSIDLWVSE